MYERWIPALRTSIIWSRNGIWLCDVQSPEPSKLMLTSTLVSFVSRLTVAVRAVDAVSATLNAPSAMHT